MAEDRIWLFVWADDRSVIVRCGDLWGKSRCRAGDEFDVGTGIGIALVRAKRDGPEVPPAWNHGCRILSASDVWSLMRPREKYRAVKKEARSQARESIGHWLAKEWKKHDEGD